MSHAHFPPQRIAFVSAALLLSTFSLGCSSSPASSSGSVTIPGTYAAQSFNGSSLPVVLSTTGGCAKGLAGAVTLTAARRFTATFSWREDCGRSTGNHNLAVGGSYTVNGSNLVFFADSGVTNAPVVNATVSGTIMTAHGLNGSATVTIVLQRQ